MPVVDVDPAFPLLIVTLERYRPLFANKKASFRVRWIISFILVDTMKHIGVLGKFENHARDRRACFGEHGTRILTQVVKPSVYETASYAP